MTTAIFDPKTTLVILLGASAWHPDRKSFAHSYSIEDNPFQRSADGMLDYFLNSLKIPAGNLKNLFDFKDNADALLEQIEEFLKESGSNKTDLFIYYVGHGTTLTGEFCFSISSAKDGKFDLSAKKLWLTLGETVFHLRCYFILDACFSGEITKLPAESGPKSALFFCSALGETLRIGKNLEDKNITVFTEILLKTLNGENPYLPIFSSWLSFNDLNKPVKDFLKKQFPEMPEPHFSSAGAQAILENLQIFKNNLNPRLQKMREKFVVYQSENHPVVKLVCSKLENLRNQELTASQEHWLEQATLFLGEKRTAQELTQFWQDHSQVDCQELSKKLQQGKVVLFLGTNVPEQDAMWLNQLKKVVNFDGHLSQLCEYIELRDGRDFLCQKIGHLLSPIYAANTFYELLAKISEPLTIISTEYTTLLEETFEKYRKPFITLSAANWHDSEKRGLLSWKYWDKSSKQEDITEEKLSALNLEKEYTLIYKIRGCVTLNKQDLILSESDYFNFARFLEESIPDYLATSIRNLGLLFIDYYPNHWEDRLIAQAILTKPNLPMMMTIHEEVDSNFTKTYWKKNNVIYSEKLSEFIRELATHLPTPESSHVS